MKDFWISFLLTAVGGAFVPYITRYVTRRFPNTSLDHSASEYRIFPQATLLKCCIALLVFAMLALIGQFVALIAVRSLGLFILSVASMTICFLGAIAVARQLKCLACGQSVVVQWTIEPKSYKKARWGVFDPRGIVCDILFRKQFHCLGCGQLYLLRSHSVPWSHSRR